MTDAPKRRAPRKASPSAAARQAEADDGHVLVEHGGKEFRIPVGGKVPLSAYIAFTNGDEMGGTQLLFGEKQWATFLATNPTVEDFRAIGRKLNELAGN